jgi:antitoxin (DNA-binding transcriptional repressor) of toxin-antitoxin stability system
MKTYKMHDAKTNLSKIINEVKEDEVIYIAKSNKVVAELRAFKNKQSGFPFGLYKGKIKIAKDWDDQSVNDEVANLFNQS